MPVRLKKPRPVPVSAAMPSPSADLPADSVSRHLGLRLKQLRADRGWSLEAMSGASGVSRSMLSEF